MILLNLRIITRSDEMDEQYEGCLSFFDVRGLVPRPRGLVRLIDHEIDHLDGLVYTARMRTGVTPIPVDEYRQTGRAWAYE